MERVINMLLGVVLFSLIMMSGTVLITNFSGSAPKTLPGYSAGSALANQTQGYMGNLSSTGESSTILTGISGVVGLIKLLVFDAPRYVALVISETIDWFGLPSVVATLIQAVTIIIAVAVGILLLRGVA